MPDRPRDYRKPVDPFMLRAADRLYDACEQAISAGRIDARSPIGDATLDYRDMRWPEDDFRAAPPDRTAARAAPAAVTVCLGCNVVLARDMELVDDRPATMCSHLDTLTYRHSEPAARAARSS